MSEPGFGAKEPPPGTPDQAGLGIQSYIGIKVFVAEPGFGAKEPPPRTPDQAGPRMFNFIGIIVLSKPGFQRCLKNENQKR